jgi:hypothetical protein
MYLCMLGGSPGVTAGIVGRQLVIRGVVCWESRGRCQAPNARTFVLVHVTQELLTSPTHVNIQPIPW